MYEETESKNTSGSEHYKIFYGPSFQNNLSTYSHLRPAVENKLRTLSVNPFFGESLKYNLSGYRSIPVKRNFLIIYGICRECRKYRSDCKGLGDNAVVLYAFGPHDDVYKIAKKLTPQ